MAAALCAPACQVHREHLGNFSAGGRKASFNNVKELKS